MMEEQDILTFS